MAVGHSVTLNKIPEKGNISKTQPSLSLSLYSCVNRTQQEVNCRNRVIFTFNKTTQRCIFMLHLNTNERQITISFLRSVSGQTFAMIPIN